jgi:uncharacterized protein HemX
MARMDKERDLKMTEGLNLTLSAATLLSVIGIAAKVYMASKPQRIEQPLVVQKKESSTPTAQCDERHAHMEKQNENMFCRLSSAEQRISALEATSQATREQLSSMDKKLDRLLARTP